MSKVMYLRKSRAEEQASTEEVLAKHREALFALSAQQGIIVTEVFEEVVSGESLSGRPEMLRLLKGVQAGQYEAVLCMDIDRLGRGGMADQGVILDAFRYSDTLIITPDKTYDLSNESDEELTEFKAFMARREYKMIRKRMRRGLMQTIEKGGYVANPPYGYEKCTVDKIPTLRIIPEEAHFVRYIYSQYLSGVGTSSIARELNAMGSVPRRNSEWSRTTVRTILMNPTYIGKIVWNRVKHYRPGQNGLDRHHVKHMPRETWIETDGIHQPIISEADFKRAQELRSGRSIPSKKTRLTTNPLAGLLICSVCGYKMQQGHAERNDTYYLNCYTTGCQASAKTEYVEESLISSLEDILNKLKLTPGQAGLSDELSNLFDLLSGTDKEIEKLEARIPKLYSFLEDGIYDKETFRVRMEAADSELAALAQRKADIAAEIEKAEGRDLTAVVNQLEHVLALYPTLNANDKNLLLKTIIEKIDYTKPKKTKPRDFSLKITLRHF